MQRCKAFNFSLPVHSAKNAYGFNKKEKKGGGGREADEDGEGLLRGPSQTLPLVGQRCPHPRQKRTAGKWCPTSDRKFQAVSPARRRLFL